MNNLRVILTKGLPASGKSTFAKELLEKEPGVWKRTNRDLLREMFDYNVWSGKNEKFIIKARNVLILLALENGYNVVVDDCNINPKNQTQIEQLVRDKADVEIKDLTSIGVEECVIRDKKRPNPVGEKVIRDMAERMLVPIKTNKNDNLASQMKRYQEQKTKAEEVVYAVEIDPDLPMAILCDLDGTLAILNGRDPYDASSCEKDGLNAPVAHVVKLFNAVKGNAVILMSGRMEKDREPTEKWLRFYGIPYEHLLMRKNGDFRKDSIIKKELFDENVRGKYNIEFCLDDRNSIVSLWRSMGLVCFQVNYGSF